MSALTASYRRPFLLVFGPLVDGGRLFALIVLELGVGPAAAGTSTWEGVTGDWSDDVEWDPDSAPDADNVDVEFDGGEAGTASTVTLDVDAKVLSLTIDAGDTLEMNNNRMLNVYGGGKFSDKADS